jgi:DNA-binding PadR family transcriptional regulator
VPYLKRVTLSFETLIWVRTQKAGSSSARSVLRVLADHAGQDHSCYLRTRLIAAETELSESTIRDALARLIEQGLIRVYERHHASGARKSNRYQLLIDGAETPEPDAEDWADVRRMPEGTHREPEGGAPGAGGGTRREPEGFPTTEASSSEATPVKGAATQRATRIPDNYQPTEEMRAWFVAEQLGAVIDGRIEHDKFVDYWLGCPGVKGRKVDWPATWRNWMRTAAERAPRRPGNGLVPTSGAPYRPSTTDARISQGMALAAKYEEQGL